MPRARDEDEDDLEGITCPKCGEFWPRGTVICTDCGWNFVKKKSMKTRVEKELAELPTYFRSFVRWRPSVTRSSKGKSQLTVERRLFGFIPLGPLRFDLKRYNQLVTDYE